MAGIATVIHLYGVGAGGIIVELIAMRKAASNASRGGIVWGGGGVDGGVRAVPGDDAAIGQYDDNVEELAVSELGTCDGDELKAAVTRLVSRDCGRAGGEDLSDSKGAHR